MKSFHRKHVPLMVLCKCAHAHLIWKAKFNLISKTDLFMSFHIVLKISLQLLQDKRKSQYFGCTVRNFAQYCIILDSYFLPLIQKWAVYMYLQVHKFTDRSFIYRLQMFLFKFTSLSRLFHSYRDEPIGRWSERIVPRKKHLTNPQAELGLSHM